MARGWESKAVEAQQDEASRRPVARGEAPVDPAVAQRRQSLLLARARVVSELATARATAHRKMLESAKAALEADLAALEPR